MRCSELLSGNLKSPENRECRTAWNDKKNYHYYTFCMSVLLYILYGWLPCPYPRYPYGIRVRATVPRVVRPWWYECNTYTNAPKGKCDILWLTSWPRFNFFPLCYYLRNINLSLPFTRLHVRPQHCSSKYFSRMFRRTKLFIRAPVKLNGV